MLSVGYDNKGNSYIYAKDILEDKGDPIFYIIEQLSLTNPQYNARKLKTFNKDRARYEPSKLSNMLLFDLHEIYFNGRFSGQPDCPPEVAKGLQDGLKEVYAMYKSFEPNSLESVIAFKNWFSQRESYKI